MVADDGPFANKMFVNRSVEGERMANIYFDKIRPIARLYGHNKIPKSEYNKTIISIYYEIIQDCKDEKTVAYFVDDDWVKFSLRDVLP